MVFCVGWEQKVIAFDYILVRKRNNFSPSQQSRGCFVLFCSLEAKELFKAVDPQFEHIIGLGLHSIHQLV